MPRGVESALGGPKGEGSAVAGDLLSRALDELPLLVAPAGCWKRRRAVRSGTCAGSLRRSERLLFRLRLRPAPWSCRRSGPG